MQLLYVKWNFRERAQNVQLRKWNLINYRIEAQ